MLAISKSITLASLLLSLAVGAAGAVSLQNKDSEKYNIRVTGSSTMSTSISGGTVKNGICSSSCTIEVEGVGEIDASGSDRVIIRDGRLSK
ncbi:MAG: hypothetical protein AAF468_12255 [Pseudomonadota bacterium]